MTNLRILTYNLEFGGRKQIEAIYTILNHCQADIIALTEADDPEVVSILAQRLACHHIWAEGSGDRHIATLSRFPIRQWHIYNKPPLTQAVLETAIETPNAVITLFNVHFLPYLLLPFEIRRWQAVGKLLALIKAKSPGPHLIVGDLNAIGPGDRVLQNMNPPRMRRVMLLQLRLIFRLAIPRLLKAGYLDCFRHLHPHEDGFTWWTAAPTTRYDYIMADPLMAARLQTCVVVNEVTARSRCVAATPFAVYRASDHFPILAEFAGNDTPFQ
jgi:exonuclease III